MNLGVIVTNMLDMKFIRTVMSIVVSYGYRGSDTDHSSFVIGFIQALEKRSDISKR